MCDLIQFDCLLYSWGKSSLGDFIAARSDRGLVAFEFASPDGNAVEELQARFPNVVLTRIRRYRSISAAPTMRRRSGNCCGRSRRALRRAVALSRHRWARGTRA